MNSRQLFLLGVRHGIPVVLGYIPVGIAYAVSALQAGFSPFETILMSLTVYSGAGQVLGVGMTAQGAGLAAIFIGTFLINFRYFIMSACVFNRMPTLKLPLKIWSSFYITDETFAIFTTAPQERAKFSYIIGIILFTYFSWTAGAVIGVVASSVFPDWVAAGLGIALYALFIALVIPSCKTDHRIAVLVIMTAIFNCLLSMFIESSWAIVSSTLLWAAIGAFLIKPKPYIKKDEKTENKQDLTVEKGIE